MSDPAPGACQNGSCRAEIAALRERLAAAEDERSRAQRAATELADVVDEVVRQCVTLERLWATVDHREVLRAIQDLVVNLVGSEELAIFELSPSGDHLEVALSSGVAAARLRPIRLGEGPLGRAAAEGRVWFRGDGASPADADLHAWVPLRAEAGVVAALAVWRLLGHKPALRLADRRVLQLLASHAGNVLDLTSPYRPRAHAA